MQQYRWFAEVSKKKLYYGLAAIIIGVVIAGGTMWKMSNQPKPVVEEKLTARTAVIGATKDAQGYTYSGEVRGRYESKLAFQVNGKIVKRNVQLGSAVNAGDVLMQIDPKDVQQTVNSSSAQVYSAESQLKLAENNLDRYQHLYETGAVSRMTYDQYAAAYDAAVAVVRQASAQYAQGVNQLDYTSLQADKTGVISSIAAEVGQVVSAGQTIVTVVQDGEREVEISVPENRIEELSQATRIKVTFWALSGRELVGKVREIAPMADPATRTFKVRISLLNPPQEVKLGMTAAVNVVNSNVQQMVSIPLSAIYQDNNTPSVWVVQENVLSLRPVKLGQYGDNTVQVLEGLQQGERIVVAGVHKFREGQTVNVGGERL